MLKKPVFIVGVHRTGSTLVKNMLDLHSEIAIIPEEMHLWDPYPWANVVLSNCNNMQFSDYEEVINFVEKLFSKSFYGSFWKNIDQYQIRKEEILSDLEINKNNQVQFKDILDIIFENFLKHMEKKRFGVKYPIHISKISLLRDWYPDCKIIHLTRDPRAVYSSKSNDEFSKNVRRKFKRIEFIVLIATLLRVVFEYNWSRRIHKKYKNVDNYMLLRYEDLVINPEMKIKKICDFLEIPFEENMLFPSGKPSSYSGKTKKGFDKNRINSWKNKISRWEKFLVIILARKSLKEFNYY